MRHLTHPATLYLVSLLIIPATALTDSTGSKSLVVLLLVGGCTLWFAFAWALNLRGAWDRRLQFRSDHPTSEGLMTRESAGPGAPAELSRVPSGIALAVWGLILTGAGIYGFAQLLQH